MALTDDQKAMLRLLAQREEGYEDMAALMGIGVEEVRARVKEALAEVDRSGEALGQAPVPPPAPAPDPPPPAPAPEAPKPDAGQEAPPPAPQAREVPQTPQPASKPPAPRRTRLKRPAAPSGLKLPKDRGALIGLGAGVLALVVLVIVLAVSGDSDSSSSSTTASTTPTEGASSPTSSSNLTEAVLAPSNGGDASGHALFGRFKKNVLLQVEAEGLDPAPQGQSYSVWLYRSPKIALRIGSAPEQAGKIAAQLAIPPQLLAYVANGAFDQIDLSLTSDAAYKAALTKAKSEKTLPPYVGESVLRGAITGPAIKKQ